MNLTPRRKEFFDAICQHYRTTGEPLHYEDVARILGVSKWTAYDMVKKLAQDGLVAISYVKEKDKRQVGRSRIAITPNNVKESSPSLNSGKILELLHLLRNTRHDDREDQITVLLEEASSCDSREIFCAYVITVVMLLTHRFLRKGFISLLESVLIASHPELGLVTAAGLLLGIIIRAGTKSEVSFKLQKYITSFQQYVAEFTEEERSCVYSFWQQALNFCTSDTSV